MKKEMNNKGFSLVELIIVIAIMVVLVAVLAPQYLKYVEKSRVSADVQTADQFIGAMQVLAADPDVKLTGTKYEVTSDTSGKITIDADLAAALKAANILDLDGKTFKYQSKVYTAQATAITLEFKDNIWTVTTTGIPDTTSSVSGGAGGGGGTP